MFSSVFILFRGTYERHARFPAHSNKKGRGRERRKGEGKGAICQEMQALFKKKKMTLYSSSSAMSYTLSVCCCFLAEALLTKGRGGGGADSAVPFLKYQTRDRLLVVQTDSIYMSKKERYADTLRISADHRSKRNVEGGWGGGGDGRGF